MRKILAVGASVALVPLTSGCVMDVWAYGAQNRNAVVIYNHNGSGRNYTGSSGSVDGQPVGRDTCEWILRQRLDAFAASAACTVHNEWTPGTLGYIDLSTDGS